IKSTGCPLKSPGIPGFPALPAWLANSPSGSAVCGNPRLGAAADGNDATPLRNAPQEYALCEVQGMDRRHSQTLGMLCLTGVNALSRRAGHDGVSPPHEASPAMLIVLAGDGRPMAARAARHVAKRAARFKAPPKIVLLTVDPPMMPGVERKIGKATVQKIHEANTDEALRDARAILDKAGVAYEERRIVGEVAPSII